MGKINDGAYARGQKVGQEAGSQEDGFTRRFWDALTEPSLRPS